MTPAGCQSEIALLVVTYARTDAIPTRQLKHYLLLGGNQGDKVQVTFFPKTSWSLHGYRWPE